MTPLIVRSRSFSQDVDLQELGGVGSGGQGGILGFFLRVRYPIWVNYNELTTSSLEIMVSKGNHPQMALIQVSELL